MVHAVNVKVPHFTTWLEHGYGIKYNATYNFGENTPSPLVQALLGREIAITHLRLALSFFFRRRLSFFFLSLLTSSHLRGFIVSYKPLFTLCPTHLSKIPALPVSEGISTDFFQFSFSV